MREVQYGRLPYEVIQRLPPPIRVTSGDAQPNPEISSWRIDSPCYRLIAPQSGRRGWVGGLDFGAPSSTSRLDRRAATRRSPSFFVLSPKMALSLATMLHNELPISPSWHANCQGVRPVDPLGGYPSGFRLIGGDRDLRV
jgi:hypothetical protein